MNAPRNEKRSHLQREQLSDYFFLDGAIPLLGSLIYS